MLQIKMFVSIKILAIIKILALPPPSFRVSSGTIHKIEAFHKPGIGLKPYSLFQQLPDERID
jgi:hypothetical protein